MVTLWKLLLIGILATSTVAVPVQQRGQCARYCTEENDFKLSPGTTYTYDYETTSLTSVQESSKDKTQLQLTAQADIEVLSKCELSLRLRGVTLKLSDPKGPDYLVSLRGVREFARAIEKYTLRFSYQNGQIEHVCPLENVPSWVLNIHKGVLSAFQTYVVKRDWTTRIVEADILGRCSAEYHSLGETWQGLHTIRKIKDLTSCSERENVETYLQGVPHSHEFSTKSLPVVKGLQVCEHVIKNDFLQSSTCNEKLEFRPFSNRGGGVVTTVSQKLTFSATSEKTFTGNDYRPTIQPLTYTHTKQETNSVKHVEDAEKALKNLCEVSKDDITISVPRKFSNLIVKLRNLNLQSLESFYGRVESICPQNTKGKKFFMDAVPLISTSDSARLMLNMISKGMITESERKFWLTSLSFISETTPEIISIFTPLLDGRYEQAILGISSLIHNYCKSNNCSNVNEVQEAVYRLTENLGENCFSNDERTIILSLKALGNIGHLYGREKSLEECYKNPQIRTEVRLAAIEAFRRVECDVSRARLMSTYRNYNENTEMRIAAYLGVMKCPTNDVIQHVNDVLTHERINHVGSFIWTHLNALAKTRHPEKQMIRKILSNLNLLNKYESDARKFSSAREATFYLESLDAGIHIDNHLVFSTESFLPRTAMLNLTLDVFGKTCNLLQIDGRMEGWEHVVESFFGPSGYFPQKNIAKFIRERRSADTNKLNQIDSQFNEHRPVYSPYGSLDVKVFGTSMWYSQFRPSDHETTEINLLDIVSKMADEQEAEYSRSFVFLDTTFTIPITSGLPLKIALNGTASVGLKIGGKFNVKSFESVDIIGHLEPSGAVEIASLLTVEAGTVARSGLRVVSTLHSSTFLDGKLQVKNGEIVKAQFNMPKERVDIFNVESKVYLLHGNEEKEKTTDRKSGTHLESCTGKAISHVLGVKFCSELMLPEYRANSALHPLNGPARFNLYIEKTDATLKSYNFEALWKSIVKHDGFIRHGILSMNTPASQIDRDVRMELFLDQVDKTISLKVKTPVKKFVFDAKLANEDLLKRVVMGMKVDDKELFFVQSELLTVADANEVMYTPAFEVRIPNKRLVSVTGNILLKQGVKYTAQMQIEDLTEKPIIAKGIIETKKKDRYDMEMSLTSFPLDGTFKGYAQFGDSLQSRFTSEYRILEGKMNSMNMVAKIRNLSANALMKYNGVVNIQTSALPEYNTELSFETMKTTGHIESTVSMSVGDGARSRIHTIKLQEILRYEGDLKNNKIDVGISFKYPERNIDQAIKMSHENTEYSAKNKLEIQYAKNRQIDTDIQLRMGSGELLEISGDAKLKYPGRQTELQADLAQSSDREYRGAVSCQWQVGKRAGMVVHYKDKSEGSRLKYEVDGSVDMPSTGPISFTTSVNQQTGQFNGFGELSAGTDKYRAKVDYSARGGLNHYFAGQFHLKNNIYGLTAGLNNHRSKLSGNVEVKMPQNLRMTAKFEGKASDAQKYGSFETYWDADRDPSKRFVINGELRNANGGYESKIVAQVLRKTIKALLTTGFQGRLYGPQWKTNNRIDLELSATEKFTGVFNADIHVDGSMQQVKSHLEITTPYRNFDNTTININHLFTNQQWDSEVYFMSPFSNIHPATLSSTGKYLFRGGANIDGEVKLQTSYPGMENMFVRVHHDHNSKEFRNKAEMQWIRSKSIQYEITGLYQPTMAKGAVKFQSPFTYLEDIFAEFTQEMYRDSFKTRGQFSFAPNRAISLNLVGNHELSGRRRICTLTFDGTTFIKGMESTAMKVIYSNDGVSMNTEAETVWNRNKIASSISASIRNNRYNKNIEGKFQFTSPFRNYQNVQLSSAIELNPKSYKLNIDAQLPFRSTASFNSEARIIDLNDMEINAVAMGHYPKVMENKRFSIDFVHKLQNSKLRSNLDVSLGKERLTVLMIGLTESSFNSRNIDFSVTANTPFSNFEEMKVELSHNMHGNEYFSKLQATKNRKSSAILHKLSMRNSLNFETSLETLSDHFPSMNISIMQTMNGRQFDHNSFILWNKNQKIHMTAQYIGRSLAKEGHLKITTPFREYNNMELKLNTKCAEGDHSGKIEALWNNKNKVSLQCSFKYHGLVSMDSFIQLHSTFHGHEMYETILKYDLTTLKKEAELSFSWDIRKKYSVMLKGNSMLSRQLSNVEISFTSPFAKYENLFFSGRYEDKSPERSLTLGFENGRDSTVLTCKSVVQRNGANLFVDLVSPFEGFRDIDFSAKYLKSDRRMQAEMLTSFSDDANYAAMATYEFTNSGISGSVTLSTPVVHFENLSFQIKADCKDSRLTSDITLKWKAEKQVSVSCNIYATKSRGDMNIVVKTPLEKFKEMALSGNYKAESAMYRAEMKLASLQNTLFLGSVKTKLGGNHLADIQVNFDTPYSPYKNVQLMLSVDSTEELYQLSSTLKWEDKKADVQLLLNRRLGQFYEAKVKMNTPFEGFRKFDIDSSLRNDKNQFIDGRLIVKTPFELIRNFDGSFEFKDDDSGTILLIKIDYPLKKFDITCKLSDRRSHPISASIVIEAPFADFKTLSAETSLHLAKWNDAMISLLVKSPRMSHGFEIKFTEKSKVVNLEASLLSSLQGPNEKHTANAVIRIAKWNDVKIILNAKCPHDNHNFELEFTEKSRTMNLKTLVSSTLMKSKTMSAVIQANYKDSSKITTDLSVEAFNQRHFAEAQYKMNGWNTDATLKIQTPFLPENRAEIASSLNRRGNEFSEAKIALTLPKSEHQIVAVYENNRNQLSANMKIVSNLLPSSMELNGKYSNDNFRDIMASFSVSAADAAHVISVNLKNHDKEKFAMLKIECPRISHFNPLTVTGSLKEMNDNSVDGSLSFSTPTKEARLTGIIKNIGWENTDVLVILNTPFEPLNNIRMGGQLTTDRARNINCNFQLETSIPNFEDVGFTSKITTSHRSQEMSLILRLPLHNYQRIQLLGNVNYNPDYSSGDSRVIITIPKNKYSMYGQYSFGMPRISGRYELEINHKKYSVSGRLDRSNENQDLVVSLQTPASKTYTVGAAYGNSGNRRQIATSYSGPSNEKYNLNTTMAYSDMGNFEGEFQIETPFYDYRNLHGSINQQYRPNHVSTNAEFNINGWRGYTKMNHRNQRQGWKGSFQMGCPRKDLKMTYGRVSTYDQTEDTIELDINKVKHMKLESVQMNKRSHIILETPTIPLTMTADAAHLAGGKEINFKATSNTRVVGFKTMYQLDASRILHEAAFSWDEKANKKVKYDFKLLNTEIGKELWGKIDTPLRSLMLKGNFTKTSRSRSGGVDFYWDASRSMEKRIAVGISHVDLSTQAKTSHRIQTTVEHPRLPTDLIQTSTLTYSPTDFHLKHEFLYSRDRHQNFLMEVKANDLSRRESHYKAEISCKHPASRLDIFGTVELLDGKLESMGVLKLVSLDRIGRENVREMRGKLMKLRQEAELMMRYNDAETNFASKMNGHSGEFDISLEKKTNDQKDFTSNIKFSKRNRALDITLMKTSNSGLQISASFPKESISLKVSHNRRGNEITDAHFSLGLEQSKILKSKFNWRPKALRDLRIKTGDTLRNSVAYLRENFDDWSKELMEECSLRTSLITRAMYEHLAPLSQDLRTVTDELKKDMKTTEDAFWSMYYRNEFHMRNAVEAYKVFKQAACDVADGLALGFEVLCNMTIEYFEDIYFSLYYNYLDFAEYISRAHGELMFKVSQSLEYAGKSATRMVSALGKKICDLACYSHDKMQKVSDMMLMKLESVLRSHAPYFIDGYYYTKNVADKIRSSVNGISECISTNKYFVALTNYATSVMNTIEAFRRYEYRLSARAVLDKVYDMQILETIMNHPGTEYVSDISREALKKSVEVYHNLGMDIVVSNAVETLTNYVKATAVRYAQDLLADVYQAQTGLKYEFEPESGRVSLEVMLPTPKNSLIEVLDIQSYPEYNKVMNMHEMAAEYYENFCIWDHYYRFMKFFMPSYYLPSFNGHALISGKQHYITFDGLSYDFAGKCSYLLARDFVDGNFTAVVNYAGDNTRKSLTVLVDRQKIDVSSDYRITLNDVRTESPFQIAETVVIREGPSIRVENERKGFYILCNFVHNYCSVDLSGFYFGKTAGLLGTFNHEPTLDMMTPARFLVSDTEAFAASWEVGTARCTSNRNYATVPSSDARIHSRCEELFERSTSEFRACFTQVNPNKFMAMCLRDLSAVHENDRKAAICESSAAYFVECKNAGVPLKMPKHCVRCEKQDGSFMTEGDSIQIPPNRMSSTADVVFVIEEKACNRERVRYLSKLALGIEDNFRQKGYRDVRFSVVGFGGDRIHSAPHIHTMESNEFGDVKSLDSALNSLEFGDGPLNVLESLRFAAALNFRPGSTKKFVLVKCSTCKSEEVRAEYGEMVRTLIDGDISLHILMEQTYEMKSPSKTAKARRVVGVDKNFAYTLKDTKDAAGDNDLLAQLRIPKDVCVPLAFEVNGSSFDASYLTETKRNTNKKFMDVVARLVSRASTTGEFGTCCECVATTDGVGKSVCQRCVSEEMASMVSADTLSIYDQDSQAATWRAQKYSERRSG